jgi:hypothetical protein
MRWGFAAICGVEFIGIASIELGKRIEIALFRSIYRAKNK